MDVIVTDTHLRMTLAVIRELGQAGHTVISVARASKPSLGHASRYTAKRYTLPDEGYMDALLSLGGAEKPVLLAAGAYTLNAATAHRDAFLSAFHTLLPDHDALDAAGDKPTVARTAQALGLLVPEEYPNDAPRFPCVIKFRNGEALQLPAHRRYAIVYDETEYARIWPAMRKQGEVFVSQYISGRAYGVSAVLNEDSEPLAVLCHERVREYPLSGGPACCAESAWHAKMVEAALSLLKAMRLTGFAMVEFKGSPDKAYVLEINPRIWGTYPLSRLCGADMASIYARAAQGETLPPVRDCRYRTGVRMQYGANDLAHWISRMRTRTRTEGSVIGDFLSPRVKGGVFDWRDLPSAFAYLGTLMRKV